MTKLLFRANINMVIGTMKGPLLVIMLRDDVNVSQIGEDIHSHVA